ncbi:hypothetical protein FH972_022878 [Carpinus fangiana]|uniref:Diphthine methyltransferase n=1 Tax=Carpinus fangiana TaxID=176857 RepID=A0A5N6KU21_9ROSI|nr:hypothetical protein FH972_022878 [Carpinus fangiana]
MEKDEIVNPKSQHTVILDEPACCLAFVPHDSDHFVVGTYNLIERDKDEEHEATPASRDGRLYLFRITEMTMQQISQHPVNAGILDLKFQPCIDDCKDARVMAVASSLGFIGIYTVALNRKSGLEFQHVRNIQILPDDELVTSLTWSPMTLNEGQRDQGGRIALTSTSGAILEIDTSSPLETGACTVQCHQAEAWIVSYMKIDTESAPLVILSGGDDSCLIASEIQERSKSSGARVTPWWSTRKIHAAGVTALTPLSGPFVVSGSYDDYLRVIKIPETGGQRPTTFHELYLGGGVWRIEPFAVKDSVESYEAKLLVSCMYAGAYVVQLVSDSDRQCWESRILVHFQEHESMNYACGIVPQERENPPETTFVSCSFYDRRLCLWTA